MYHYLSLPERAEDLAGKWGIDYVALSDDELPQDVRDLFRDGGLAHALHTGGPLPAWLQPVPGGAAHLYRVR